VSDLNATAFLKRKSTGNGMTKQARIERHEKHFSKIFTTLDEIKDDYVKAPTFVITLVTIVLILAGSIGGALGIVF
jgi:hypothetical protein